AHDGEHPRLGDRGVRFGALHGVAGVPVRVGRPGGDLAALVGEGPVEHGDHLGAGDRIVRAYLTGDDAAGLRPLDGLLGPARDHVVVLLCVVGGPDVSEAGVGVPSGAGGGLVVPVAAEGEVGAQPSGVDQPAEGCAQVLHGGVVERGDVEVADEDETEAARVAAGG